MGRIGKWIKIWVEGYALSTRISNIEPTNSYEEIDVSAYTQDKNYLVGQADGAIKMEGFFDSSPDIHTALKTIINGSKLVTVAFGNNATPATGDPTASLDAQQSEYTVTPELAGAVGVSGAFKARGYPVEYGVLLADITATSNSNGSSVNNGASSANGGVGYLHITGLSAGDTITVKIQDSPDNSSWADLITFTLDGSAVDAERLEVTGTVDQYTRALWTVTGASISFPIAVAFIRS